MDGSKTVGPTLGPFAIFFDFGFAGRVDAAERTDGGARPALTKDDRLRPGLDFFFLLDFAVVALENADGWKRVRWVIARDTLDIATQTTSR